ncbi:scaffold attachment factor B2 isoform X1 [Strongylocentrotus purpuratus]|uniref:E3 ubiquitin-protein ligase RNF25 n=2 Tax=Strongylocentrotus purpuratus TaxID=7668 RepID=A0A7M7P7N2_STRPU|nr:scaffold attachment factor B2 isoform X1 [Strongylocentrotus purpuratus]
MDPACEAEMNESSNTPFSDESTFLTELEVLREICEEDIDVSDKPDSAEVCITLHPATAGNKDAQYVCLTLIIIVTSEYPDVPASFQFRNPRGLSEDELERISKDLKKLAEEKIGCEMMYDLIQAAKDSLTENNSPSLPCTICQCLFEESAVFTKTSCYHYFHSFCLAQYLKYTEKDEEEDPKCPVCREALEVTLLEKLQDAPEPSYDDCPDIVMTPDLRRRQAKMKAEFERQKAKGGHIDIEAESNKHLISISHVPNLSVEDMVTQRLKDAKLAATDAKIPQDQSKPAAEHTQRKHSEGAPVFVHNKHRDRHGGRDDGRHRGSRGHGEGRGHQRSHPKHSGRRDERPSSSRGHQRSDHQRWTGDRDRQVERRGSDGQRGGERREESRTAKDKELGELKVDILDDEKDVKHEKEKISNQVNCACTERKGSGLALSATDTKGIETKDMKKDDGDCVVEKDRVKRDEDGEEKKLNDGKINHESPGRRTQERKDNGGRDMKGIRKKEHRDTFTFHHRNDGSRHDHGQNHRRPARSDHSDVGSQKDDSQEKHDSMDQKFRNNERRGGPGGQQIGKGGSREGTGRGGSRGGTGTGDSRGGIGTGGSRGGMRRGGSRGGTGRGGSRGGTGRGGIRGDSKQERTGETSFKAGNSNEKAAVRSVKPPPGFNQKPVVSDQKCKPPPGLDFR